MSRLLSVLRAHRPRIRNIGRWSVDPKLAEWMAEARLNPSAIGGRESDLGRAIAAVGKLQRFLEDG